MNPLRANDKARWLAVGERGTLQLYRKRSAGPRDIRPAITTEEAAMPEALQNVLQFFALLFGIPIALVVVAGMVKEHNEKKRKEGEDG